MEVAEAKGRTVHYKGFGRLINFRDPLTDRYADAVVDHIVDQAYTTLVWDGDSYSHTSFTFLIPRIRAESRKRHGRDLELVAYLRECDTVRFEASWDAAPPPSADVTARWSDFIRVELQPAELDWTQLGVVAIRDTGATNVVCFGGGPIVRTEYEANAAGAPDFERAVFHWWPVERPTEDGKGVEACALIELESTLPAAEKEAYLRRHDLLKDESEDDLTGFWYFFREEDLVPITVICFVAYILIRDAYYPRPENDIDYWDFTSGAWSEQTSPSGL